MADPLARQAPRARRADRPLVGAPLVRISIVAAGAGIAGLSAAGFLDDRFWVADLASSVRAHLLFAAVVLLGSAALARSLLGVGLALVALIVNGFVLAPLYTGDPAGPAGTARVEIAHVNMQGRSGDFGALDRALEERRPDVMVILEPPLEWGRRADELDYLAVARRELDETRVLVLSSAGVTNVGTPAAPGSSEASIAFDVELGRSTVRVFAVHALAPTSPDAKHTRDEQLAAVEAWIGGHRGSEIVLGDLNATPWSTTVEALEDSNDLVNSAEGFGLQATWPAFAGPLGIPIDQLLHSRDLTVVDRQTGPSFGSAHRSLWVTVARSVPS